MAGYDGHATKRQRTDLDGYGVQSGRRDTDEDQHNVSPSPVVHVRGLYDTVTEHDVVEACQNFGSISHVIMLGKRRQSLIEYEDIQGAVNLVTYAKDNSMFVGGRPAQFNYSTSQKLERHGNTEHGPNNVLLFTVLNPQYPITCDVMHTICSKHGTVNRIVIFKKNGVQAMVEFEDLDTAKRAKQALAGCDIYSGCCTLKIDFAKPTKLNVFKNDNESYDYTNPNLGMGMDTGMKSAPLLPEPRYGGQGAGGGGYGKNGGGFDDGYGAPPPRERGPPPMERGGYGSMDYQGYDPYGRPPPPDRYGAPPQRQQQQRGYPPQYDQGPADPYGSGNDQYGNGSLQPTPPGMIQQGAVMMVYGLSEQMNCDKLFNMLCLYGNIVRIKYLRSKQGSAMVQMGNPDAVDKCMKNLNGTIFYGSKLQLNFSKQAFLQDVPNPHTLNDDTPSFKDYMGNKNNRFNNPQQAAKNRIIFPTKCLHYFNAPPGLGEDELIELFTDAGATPPVKVKIFQSKSDKSSTGLIEWETIANAIEALVNVNHKEIKNPASNYPYTFKLCFSASPIMEKPGGPKQQCEDKRCVKLADKILP